MKREEQGDSPSAEVGRLLDPPVIPPLEPEPEDVVPIQFDPEAPTKTNKREAGGGR